jgi:hypothetical protein
MKIKSWELKLTWEDGTEHDVSNYVPTYTSNAIEGFIDYWEEKHGEEDNDEDEDEEESYAS